MNGTAFIGGASTTRLGGQFWATSALVKLRVTEAGVWIGPSGMLAGVLSLGWMPERTYEWTNIDHVRSVPSGFLRPPGVEFTIRRRPRQVVWMWSVRRHDLSFTFYTKRAKELLTLL